VGVAVNAGVVPPTPTRTVVDGDTATDTMVLTVIRDELCLMYVNKVAFTKMVTTPWLVLEAVNVTVFPVAALSVPRVGLVTVQE
jgi:hypothetical protein